jgi:hypothetical protein
VVNHPPPDPNHAGELPKPLDPNHAGESHTANSCFMPLANRPPNLFIRKGKKREREREREREKEARQIRRNPAGYRRNHCLRGILGKKIKSGHVRRT